MMIYDISKFEELVEQKYLRKSTKGDLVLYTYTEKCTYEKFWNEYTRISRGIILNKNTGEVVAKPFPKFFNIGEMPETFIANLPNEEYEVSEKVDGSLGIIFHYNGEWQIATKGSFDSEQSIKAQEILKKYDLTTTSQNVTILTEIIYPQNRIVVNYGNEEKLMLLGAYNRTDCKEISDIGLLMIHKYTQIPLRKEYSYSINEMVELQKTLPKDQEGFVVKFENGLRLKIKGEEYLKIHKIVTNLSPLSFWEVMENGKVPLTYIQQVPEEFKDQFEPIVNELEKIYQKTKNEVEEEFQSLPTKEITPEAKKQVGLYIKQYSMNHGPAMFPMLMKKEEVVDSYIMKQIRPKGNVLHL